MNQIDRVLAAFHGHPAAECVRDGEIDFNLLARLASMSEAECPPGSFSTLQMLVDQLAALPFPPGYVKHLEQEMKLVLRGNPRETPASVYLAFYGFCGQAEFLKVGVSTNVGVRIRGATTDNPVPQLWAFSADLHCVREARKLERAILEHLRGERLHGEWVCVGRLDETGATALAGELSDFAASVCMYPPAFTRRSL